MYIYLTITTSASTTNQTNEPKEIVKTVNVEKAVLHTLYMCVFVCINDCGSGRLIEIKREREKKRLKSVVRILRPLTCMTPDAIIRFFIPSSLSL